MLSGTALCSIIKKEEEKAPLQSLVLRKAASQKPSTLSDGPFSNQEGSPIAKPEEGFAATFKTQTPVGESNLSSTVWDGGALK